MTNNITSIPGFIRIPGSEGYTNADGVTGKRGWAVAVGQMTFFDDSSSEEYYGGARYDKASKNALVSCVLGNKPINMITADEALYAAQNLLVDANGSKLKNGSLLDIGLWKLLVRDIVSVGDNFYNGKLYTGNSCGRKALCVPDGASDGYEGVKKIPRRRRYYTLSSGERIWDFCGNLWEFYRERHDGGNGGDVEGRNIFSVQDVIGEDNEKRYLGCAFGRITSLSQVGTGKQYAADYGGCWTSTGYAGVCLSDWGKYDPESYRDYCDGFRCVVPLQ